MAVSGLQLVKFDFVKKSKLTFLWNFDFFSCYFVCLVNTSLLHHSCYLSLKLIFLCLHPFWQFFFLFQDNKAS